MKYYLGTISNSVFLVSLSAALLLGLATPSLIAQYPVHGVSWTPSCGDFTQTSAATYFSFAELKSPDADWAILTSSVTAGLDAIRSGRGSALTLSRAYSTPAHNSEISTASNSRHVYGDAGDIQTGSQAMWSEVSQLAKGTGACVEPQLQSTLSHVHADWRGGCPAGW
jgi:hypothetical protein